MSVCNTIVADLGYECREIAPDVSQLISPFTKGSDGEHVGVYVQKISDDRYRISDGGDSLSHMLTHNIRLNKKRLDEIQRIGASEGVELTEMGELSISAPSQLVPDAVARLLSVCMHAGGLEFGWMKPTKNRDFTAEINEFLVESYGASSVETNPIVRGLSGHQIEIAFGIHSVNGVSYVEPVATRSGKLYWSGIYKVAGMMSDLREIEQNRFVIFDDNLDSDTPQIGHAMTILSEHASVLPYSNRSRWVHDLAA